MSGHTRDSEEVDSEVIRNAIKRHGKEAFIAIIENIAANSDELQKPEIAMKLQHPLRADPDAMKVFFIATDGNETEIEEEVDIYYRAKLEEDVHEKSLLTESRDENGISRLIVNEKELHDLVNGATKHTCPLNRATRAALAANTIQPDISLFKEAGEMFLQQVVYSPIAELFCAFSTSYCADKKVTCAHAVCCHETEKKNVQYSVSCSPDAALRLVTEFYLIAIMEIKSDGFGKLYERDFYRCKLMTAMSVMAIADYLVTNCNIVRDEIDIAIPFIRGNFERAELYVTRLHGSGGPKIHLISATNFWDSPVDSGKLDLFTKLAVILSRIVKATIAHKAGMAVYFGNNHNSNANAIKRNAIKDSSSKSKSTSRNADTESSKRSASGKRRSTNTMQSPADNENAAKIAASRFGLIYGLVYPFPRIHELIMFDDDKIQSQREANFIFFQQESPFYFIGISLNKTQNSQGDAVFCKVWRKGDRHTTCKNVKEEIQFYKTVNANNVPSPSVVDTLTALDVPCITDPNKDKSSFYHVLVTQYHPNDAIDENDILVFVLSFIRAVQKLHSIGIIHCDIKPSNILWDATQKMVRLIDFEHAQDEENARWYTTTRKYEAPEISLGKPHTRKSDAYSVGKTLDSMINELNKPVARDIAAVVESLLIESDSLRMTLVQAEQHLAIFLEGTKCNVVTGLIGNNYFATIGGSTLKV